MSHQRYFESVSQDFSPFDYLSEFKHMPMREMIADLTLQQQKVEQMVGDALLEEYPQLVVLTQKLKDSTIDLSQEIKEMNALILECEERMKGLRENADLEIRLERERAEKLKDLEKLDLILQTGETYNQMKNLVLSDVGKIDPTQFKNLLKSFQELLTQELDRLERIAANLERRAKVKE